MLEGQEQALRLSEGMDPTAAHLLRVAERTSPELARWAFTQWSLRAKAREKFARAGQMLFAREALEQATHEAVAAFHASLFPAGELVADLTCGIGADLIALAKRGPALGFELDSERAEYARHNLAVYGLQADIRLEDCLEADWGSDQPSPPSRVPTGSQRTSSGRLRRPPPPLASLQGRESPTAADRSRGQLRLEYAFADPARRVDGKRTLNIGLFEPDPRAIARRMSNLKLGAMKLSPMLPDATLRELAPYRAFLSFRRECPEVLLLAGSEAPRGCEAIHLESGERLPSGDAPSWVEGPGAFLHEADPAAIRADAIGVLAARYGLVGLGDSNGYLTSNASPPSSPWLRAYEVLGAHRADVGKTRALLRRLGAGTPVVKSRAGIDVEALRKELRAEGETGFCVAVYPVERTLWHAIVKPV